MLKSEINTQGNYHFLFIFLKRFLGSDIIKQEFDEIFVTYRNEYVNRKWQLRGESIVGYYLRFRETLISLCHRVIGNYSNRYMSENDELKLVQTEVFDWEVYSGLIK